MQIIYINNIAHACNTITAKLLQNSCSQFMLQIPHFKSSKQYMICWFCQAYSINGSTLDDTINTYNKIAHRDLKTNPVNIDLKASLFQYEN